MKKLFNTLLGVSCFVLALSSCSSDNAADVGTASNVNPYLAKATEVQNEVNQLIANRVSANEFGEKVTALIAQQIPENKTLSAKAETVLQTFNQVDTKIYQDNQAYTDHLQTILQNSNLDKNSDEYKKIEAAIFYENLITSSVENAIPKISTNKWCYKWCFGWGNWAICNRYWC